MVPTQVFWKPNQCKEFLERLYRSTHPEYEDIEHVINEFEVFKRNKFSPLFYPKKVAENRTLIKNGVYILNKVKHKIDANEVDEILTISDELDMDEFLAAQIYSQVQTETKDTNSAVKSSIDIFHKERGYLLAGLEFMLINCNSSSNYKFNTNMRDLVQSISYIDTSCYEIIGNSDTFEKKPVSSHKNESSSLGTGAGLQQNNSNDTEQSLNFQKELLVKIKESMDMKTIVRKFTLKASTYLKESDEDRYNQIRLEETQSFARLYFLFISNGFLDENYVISLIDLLKLCETPTTIFVHLVVAILTHINLVVKELTLSGSFSHDGVEGVYAMYTKLTEQEWKLSSAKAYVLLHVICLLENLMEFRLEVPDSINEHFLQNQLNKCYNENPFQFAAKHLFNHLSNKDDITNITKCNQPDVNLSLELSISSQLSHSQILLKHLVEYEFQAAVDECVGEFISLYFKMFGRTLLNLYLSENRQLNSKVSAEPVSAPSRLFRHTSTNVLKDTYIFEDLFTLIALTFNSNPKSSLSFLRKHEETLKHFVSFNLNELPNSKLYSSCLLMFGQLSNSSEGSFVVLRILDVKHTKTVQGSVLRDPVVKEITFWEYIQTQLLKYADERMEIYKQEANRTTSSILRVKPAPLATSVEESSLFVQRSLVLISKIFSQSEYSRTLKYPGLGISLLNPLFKLLTCPTPNKIKGLVLETLSSFITPLSNAPNSWETLIWKAVQELNLIPIQLIRFGSNSVQFKPNWKTEKNSLAKEVKTQELNIGAYHATIGLLKLIKNLVFCKQVKSPSLSGGSVSRTASVSQAIAVTDHPSVHYLSFVVKDVFSTLFAGNFHDVFHVFDVLEACLGLFQAVLSDFVLHVRGFLAKKEVGTKSTLEDISSLVYHPGFYLLVQILSGKQFISALAKVLHDGLVLDNYPVGTFAKLERTLYYALYILNSAVDLQGPLKNVILPELQNFRSIDPSHFDLPAFNVVDYFDHLLLSIGPKTLLVPLVKLVNCNTNNEIALLAFKLFGGLCDIRLPVELQGTDNLKRSFGSFGQHNLNPLLHVIWMDEEFLDIRTNILKRITSPFFNKPNLEVNYSRPSSSKVTLTILEVINKSLASGIGFSLGQFMLGFFDRSPNKSRSNLAISYDVVSPFHEIVNYSDTIGGTIDRFGGLQTIHVPATSLESKLITHSYEILQKLAVSDETSTFTLHYLNLQRDFMLLHFDELQAFVHPPEQNYNIVGRVQGHELKGQVDKVLHHISRCCSLLELGIGQLKTNYANGLPQLNTSLIKKLFTVEAYSQKNNFINSSRPYYGRMSLLNIHDVLTTPWDISLAKLPGDDLSRILNEIQFSSCKLPNTKDMYNIKLARSKFNVYISNKPKNVVQGNATDINAETSLMESYFSLLEAHQQLMKKQLEGLKIWERLVFLAVKEGLPTLNKKVQIPIALDLLKAFLQTFRLGNQPTTEQSDTYTSIISVATQFLETKFEGEVEKMNILSQLSQPQLNVNLVLEIWQGLLHILLKTHPSWTTRANMYRAIKHYFQYITAFNVISPVDSLLSNGFNASPLQLSLEDAYQLVGLAVKDACHVDPTRAKTGVEFLVFVTPLLQFTETEKGQSTSVTSKVLLDSQLQDVFFKSLCNDITQLMAENELNNYFESKMMLLSALAASNEGSLKLVESNLFVMVGKTGILATQLDRFPQVVDGNLLRLAYKIVIPVMTLIATILINSGQDKATVGAKFSYFFTEYPYLLQSVFRVAQGGLLSFPALSLIQTVVHFICFYAQNFADKQPTDFTICGAMHSQLMDLLVVFSERGAWIPKVNQATGLKLSVQKATNLADPVVPKQQKQVEVIVVTIQLNLMGYLEAVYHPKTTLIPLSSPVVFSPDFDVGIATQSMRFSARPTLRMLFGLFNETVQSLSTHLIHYKGLVELQSQDPLDFHVALEIVNRGKLQGALPDLSLEECIAVAKEEVGEEINHTVSAILKYLYLTELCFVQLTHHLSLYLDSESKSYPFAKPNLPSQLDPKLATFIRALNSHLVPCLKLLAKPTQELELAQQLGKSIWGEIQLKESATYLLSLIPPSLNQL